MKADLIPAPTPRADRKLAHLRAERAFKALPVEEQAEISRATRQAMVDAYMSGVGYVRVTKEPPKR